MLIDGDSIISTYSQTVISSRCQIAVACLLLYDAIITIDREIKYFWTVPGQFVSLIYFTNRYIGISTAVFNIWFFSLSATKTLCEATYWSHLVADWITLIIIDYILLLRVAALYFENRRVVRWLQVLFVLEALAELAMMLLNVLQRIGVQTLGENVRVCRLLVAVLGGWRGFGVLSWTIPIVYSVILMTMAAHRTVQIWRTSILANGQNRSSSLQLVKILVRDQAIYFFAVILCSVSNIIAGRLKSNAYADVFLYNVFGSPSLLCVLGSHLLFHLKEAAERNKYCIDGNFQQTNEDMQSFWAGESSIRFG